MAVLTGIVVLGVQRYVFASNRLRDTVSASWLVHWATASKGAPCCLEAEKVLLASGGNAALLFSDLDRARDGVARYTRLLHERAPGLEVAIAHVEYADGELAEALARLQVELARAKLERLPSVPQLGLSVTASCRITGLPATGFDPQDASIPLSTMVLRWRNRELRQKAVNRWRFLIEASDRFSLPPAIDDLGRTRAKTSLLGVVHVDGNGIGRGIARWLEQCRRERRADDEVREQLTAISAAIDRTGHRALQAVFARVLAAVDVTEGRISGTVPDLGFDLRKADDKLFAPIRPVLLGGDDITFLCDGRIALDLAEAALDAFATEIPQLARVTASAGVALVPAHAPFERAYELAEALCASAKRRRSEKEDDGSWIDWHIGLPRPGEGIAELRARAYVHRTAGTALDLTCRPYRLGGAPSEAETWRWLSRTVLGTGAEEFRGAAWRQHRNKLKALSSVVREGPEGVRRAREGWTAAAELAWPGGLGDTDGFLDGRRTPLLDAVELLDIHLPLCEGGS